MLSADDFSLLKNYIVENSGIDLPESNYNQVHEYVGEVLSRNQFNLIDYFKQLLTDIDEYDRFMKVVTINETYFFREEKQFRLLYNHLFQQIDEKEVNENSVINIWSSSCSSGEEAISLLALSRSFFKNRTGVCIYASDISQDMLNHFKKGNYRPGAFRNDGSSFHSFIKEIALEQKDNTWQIDGQYLNEIRISKRNLFSNDLDSLPQMDLIFLRNTLIYMNLENKRIIIDNVVNKLKIGGFLFLSSVEIPLISHPSLIIEEFEDSYYLKKIDPLNLSEEHLNHRITHVLNRTKRIDVEELLRRRREDAGKEKKKDIIKKPAIREEDVCQAIQMQLNNELYLESTREETRSASFYINIQSLINQNKFNEVEKILNEKMIDPPSLFYFFQAYNFFLEDEKQKAKEKFQKVLSYNSRFWPARYYLIKLLPENEKFRKNELKTIIRDIEVYINSHRYDYQFLLEGFNARYFLLICQNILKDSIRRHLPHGH